jgi:hypothetical protein
MENKSYSYTVNDDVESLFEDVQYGIFLVQILLKCRWLTLVILATQEAEIRRITVQS